MSPRFFGLDREIAQVEFNKTIAGCYRDGNAEYDSVGVLLLTWKEDDMHCKETEVNKLEQVFQDKFNYNTEHYEIPPTESNQSLFNRLQAFTRCYDCPSKLGIIYYGGHADRKETKDGVDLELFARRTIQGPVNGDFSNTITSLTDLPESPVESKEKMDASITKAWPEQPHISFRAICEQIKTSETDMLLVVDSCFAAGAFTDQPFGGRKCELFCSIAEKDFARAPGLEGSFTKILTTALVDMIDETPEGFSTSDLYRRIYQQQHKERKPFHFTQSRFDFGRIWLRPCRPKNKSIATTVDSKYTIDVRFHLTKSLDMMELNKVVKALQWIPYVQMIKMQNMHSPSDNLSQFIRTAYLANRLRPVLARVRRKLELERARQLRKTDSSPPSPSAATSERFHVHEPRDVGLFDWSKVQAVTPYNERLTSDQYFDSNTATHLRLSRVRVPNKVPEYPAIADAALHVISREEQADAPARHSGGLSQRMGLPQQTLDRLSFFVIGLLAPTLITWAVQGTALPFAAH